MSEGYFSLDYAAARSRFRTAVERADGGLHTLELDAKGPTGEDLTIDVAWFGADRPRRALLVSSGVHGVEAFTGSAIQLQLLDEGLPAISDDSAVILVHVVNPYGMAWLRRFNEENVDLNRNFLGPDERFEGAPEDYEKFDSFLNPKSQPSWGFYQIRVAWLIARYGMPKLKQTVAGGQYVNPKGLFFGGKRLQQGPRLIQEHIAERLSAVRRLVVIDLHTGLGKLAEDTLLVHWGDEGSPVHREMTAAFGERVAPLDPERGVAFRVRGAYDTMFRRLLPHTNLFFATQEFGTRSPASVLYALREENRWHHYGGGGVDHPAKHRLKEAFNPDHDTWRDQVLSRGKEVLRQAEALAFGG